MALFTLTDIQKILAELKRRLRLLEIRGGAGVLTTGLAADLPATPDVSTGTTVMYYAYDTKTLYIWNIDTETWNTEIFT